MKTILTEKTWIVFIVAVAVVAVLAIVTLSSKPEGNTGTHSLIDYSTGLSRKPTISYAPPEAHQPGHGHDHGEERPQNVPLHDLHLDKAMNFDAEKGEKGVIIYRLDKPAMVTIRVLKEGTRELYLATIVNSEFRDKGKHTETWDGRDYSGNVIDMTKAFMRLGAVEASGYDPGKMELAKKSPEEAVHAEHEWGHAHEKHHEWAEEVPFLKVLNIRKGETLSGKVRIEAEVDEEKRGYGNQYGYGVRYYVDNILAHEEFYKPECDGHFAYEFDTTAFVDGEHMLYVGMCDHNQHTTSAGVCVVFDNSTTKRNATSSR